MTNKQTRRKKSNISSAAPRIAKEAENDIMDPTLSATNPSTYMEKTEDATMDITVEATTNLTEDATMGRTTASNNLSTITEEVEDVDETTDVTPVAVPTCAIDDPEYAEDVHISREIDDFTEQPAPDFISEDSLQSQQDTTNSSVSESEESSDEEVEYVRGPLGNKFMDTKQILELLKSPHALLPDIPTGRKDGMYFFLDIKPEKNRKTSPSPSVDWLGYPKTGPRV